MSSAGHSTKVETSSLDSLLTEFEGATSTLAKLANFFNRDYKNLVHKILNHQDLKELLHSEHLPLLVTKENFSEIVSVLKGLVNKMKKQEPELKQSPEETATVVAAQDEQQKEREAKEVEEQPIQLSDAEANNKGDEEGRFRSSNSIEPELDSDDEEREKKRIGERFKRKSISSPKETDHKAEISLSGEIASHEVKKLGDVPLPAAVLPQPAFSPAFQHKSSVSDASNRYSSWNTRQTDGRDTSHRHSDRRSRSPLRSSAPIRPRAKSDHSLSPQPRRDRSARPDSSSQGHRDLDGPHQSYSSEGYRSRDLSRGAQAHLSRNGSSNDSDHRSRPRLPLNTPVGLRRLEGDRRGYHHGSRAAGNRKPVPFRGRNQNTKSSDAATPRFRN